MIMTPSVDSSKSPKLPYIFQAMFPQPSFSNRMAERNSGKLAHTHKKNTFNDPLKLGMKALGILI